jgi:glucose-6-phosphate isomerase
MSDRSDLIIAALQQRMGEMVVGYETQIAVLRADLTQLLDEANGKQQAIKEYEDSLGDLK